MFALRKTLLREYKDSQILGENIYKTKSDSGLVFEICKEHLKLKKIYNSTFKKRCEI